VEYVEEHPEENSEEHSDDDSVAHSEEHSDEESEDYPEEHSEEHSEENSEEHSEDHLEEHSEWMQKVPLDVLLIWTMLDARMRINGQVDWLSPLEERSTGNHKNRSQLPSPRPMPNTMHYEYAA
jgi:hypothetical protein